MKFIRAIVLLMESTQVSWTRVAAEGSQLTHCMAEVRKDPCSEELELHDLGKVAGRIVPGGNPWTGRSWAVQEGAWGERIDR